MSDKTKTNFEQLQYSLTPANTLPMLFIRFCALSRNFLFFETFSPPEDSKVDKRKSLFRLLHANAPSPSPAVHLHEDTVQWRTQRTHFGSSEMSPQKDRKRLEISAGLGTVPEVLPFALVDPSKRKEEIAESSFGCQQGKKVKTERQEQTGALRMLFAKRN